MTWQRAGSEELSEVLSFLSEREWSCVSLTSRLIQADGAALKKQSIQVARRKDDSGGIGAVLYASPYGLVIPVFDAEQENMAAALTPPVPRELHRRWSRLHSVMGLKSHVLHVEKHLPRAPTVSIDYHLMEREPEADTMQPAAIPGLLIRRAYPDDADLLYPLQEAYEKEEVLVRPDRFDPLSCLLHLQESLRNQLVYLAEIEGQAVSKAATNARGIRYDQLGGIFTRPEFRNRGIGERILREMLSRLSAEERKTTLFVKQDNESAIALYRKLRFSIREEFRISYFI